MNYDILVPEIRDDPLGRGYAAMSDVEVTTSLNAVDRSRMRPLTMKELREWAAVGTRALNVHLAVDDATKPDEVRNICLVADKLLGTDDGSLEPGNPAHVALINGLVSAGIITADDRADLVARATEAISRAAELGIGRVKVGYVEKARA